MIIYKNTIDGFINDCYNEEIVKKLKYLLDLKEVLMFQRKRKYHNQR